MRKIALTICLLAALLPAVDVFAQAAGRTARISRPCSGSSTPAKAEIESDGDLVLSPCSTRAVKVVDPAYTPFFTGTNYLSIASDSSLAVPAADNVSGLELNFPWALSNTSSRNFAGVRTHITPSGSPTAAGSIFGNFTYIFTNAYTPVDSANSKLYGNYSLVDVGFPVGQAYAGYFSASHGSSQASGAGTIVGVYGIAAGGHNGDLTNAYAGQFVYGTSASSPLSTTSNAIGLYVRSYFNSGTAATTFKGLAIQDYNVGAAGGGTVGTAYGIFLDNTISVGSTNWTIYSASTAPNFFAGKDTFDATNTAGGTTGNQTINKPAFSVNFAAGASSLVVTNSFITANSYVLCSVQTNDSTALLKNATPAAGSVTIRLNAAATAETRVACLVVN